MRDRLMPSVAVLLAVASSASALPPGAVMEPERDDMPFIPASANPRTSLPANILAPEVALRGTLPVFIRQINTNASGLNIVGDAANEPSITVDPTDPRRLVAGWRQFNSIASSFRQAGVAFSRDNGRTWTNLPPLEAGVFRSDPIVRWSPDGSTVFYNSLKVVSSVFNVWYFTSSDGGATWSSPYQIAGGDKVWFAIDSTNGPGRNHHYTAWNVAANPTPGFTFARSINAGASFQAAQALPGGPPIFGTLGIGPVGQLYIAGTNSGGPGLSVVRSTNASNNAVTPTFLVSTPNMDGDLALNPAVNPAGLAGQLLCDVDRSGGPGNGFVYVCGTIDPATGTDPLEARFIRSRDGGVTWDPFVRVNDDSTTNNAFQWFVTMSVAPNGRIDVIYNDTREDPMNRISRTYYTFSTDQGATFAPSTPMTVPWNPLVGFPQQNKIGDYYDMHSDNVGADAIISTTVNGEQDVYYVRIGEFDCNGNGVGDTTEIALGQVKDCNGDGIPDPCTKACVADINGDGSTNTADLTLFLGQFGLTVTLCNPANLNLDTQVDTADLVIFLGNFGCAG
ncbi:MAG: hypothetical protein ACKVZJ_11575 [Phycisphaerales bacterium]